MKFVKWLERQVKDEPVRTFAFARSIIVLFTAFGLSLSPEQIAAVYLSLEAGLGWYTHSKVSGPQGDRLGRL